MRMRSSGRRARPVTWMIGNAAVVAIVSTSLAAQQNSAQQPGTTITVTGCLQRPQSAGSVAGTPTGTPASPNQADYRANSSVPDPGYILAGATAKTGADAPTGTSGTSGARDKADETSTSPMTYALLGDEATLAPHVGHTVEIQGVVAPPVAARPPSNTPDPAPPPSRQTDPVGSAFQTGVRQLRVAAVRMTANSCAQRP